MPERDSHRRQTLCTLHAAGGGIVRRLSGSWIQMALLRKPRKLALALALVALALGCNRLEPDAPAHEAAAARELRAVASAQVDYARAYGGFACSLAQLGPPMKNVKPSLDAAGLID